jgi:integrase
MISDVTRVIPLNPALKQLLEAAATRAKPKPTDRICKVSECQEALTGLANWSECKRITHHDLRHYFVTKCLQAGVDVFTLAKWVGHRDNGKLLLKVYSHLASGTLTGTGRESEIRRGSAAGERNALATNCGCDRELTG